jgi:hypothetical protein
MTNKRRYLNWKGRQGQTKRTVELQEEEDLNWNGIADSGLESAGAV